MNKENIKKDLKSTNKWGEIFIKSSIGLLFISIIVSKFKLSTKLFLMSLILFLMALCFASYSKSLETKLMENKNGK